MIKNKKNLTSILYVIGKSDIPLSSTQIKRKTQLSRYIYEMLRILAPSKITLDIPLFILEDLTGDDTEKRYESVKKILNVFDIKWEISEDDLKTKYIKIQKKDNLIKITHGNNNHIKIILELNSDRYSIISFFRSNNEDSRSLIKNDLIFFNRNQQKKLTAYTIKFTHLKYLNIDYDDTIKKKLKILENKKTILYENKDIEKSSKLLRKIQEIEYDRSNWRYSLNIRGFILYLYSEYELKNRNRKKRIEKIISNPQVKNKFPFLELNKDFRKLGLDICDLLFSIANEFESQLHYDEHYLSMRITERYFLEIEKYLDDLDKEYTIIDWNRKIKGLKEYRIKNYEYLKNNMIYYLNTIEKRLEELHKNN
ncbi:MAG: hypothetical protein ACPKPY_09820 [Nitrososphaeraceae archaeon]